MRLEAAGEEAEGTFYVLEAPEWINIIPVTAQEEVVLVEQYRVGTEEPTLEIPGGMVDPGEKPIEGAKRELLEETGYRSGRWTSLGRVSSNPAIMTNYTHIYLAEECVFKGTEHSDLHERIRVHKLPLSTFLQSVRDGTIHHAIVVAAVARYLLSKAPPPDFTS